MSRTSEEASTRRAELGLPQQAPAPAADAAPGLRSRERGKRRPFGTQEQKLAYPNREGFHRHWFNDEPGRIGRAEAAGYTKVVDEEGKPVCTVVGTARGGGALIAYLMEMPEGWWQEDLADRDSITHELMAQIRQGVYKRPDGADGDKHYAGSTRGSIHIETNERR